MSYLGSAPAPSGSVFAGVYSQSFNGNGSTTTFTLGRYVAQAANIEVIVNNVQQSPFDGSYSLSGGTSLVFSEAPSAGTNNIYVIYRDYPVQTLTDTGAVRKTGDTITGDLTISNAFLYTDGATQTNIQLNTTQSGSMKWRMTNEGNANRMRFLGTDGTNTVFPMYFNSNGAVTMPAQPAFSATRNAGDVAYNTEVVYNTVAVNTGNCYNATTGRFTAPVTGNYFFTMYGMGINGVSVIWLQIRKNGAVYNNQNPYHENVYTNGIKYLHAGGSVVMQMNAGDYASVVTGSNSSTTMYAQGNAHNGFSGYLIG